LGFLDKLFGKKVEEEEKPLVIQLEGLGPWLERRIKETERDAIERLKPVMEEIQDSRDAAKEVVLEIKEYEFPPDIKKRVYKPVLTSKPAYAKAMLDGLGAIDSREARSFEDLEEFHKAVLNVMKVIQKTQLGKGRYMTIAFRDEMLKIGTALNRIIESLNALGEALKEGREELDRLKGVISMAEELISKVEAVRNADKRDIDGEIKALRENRKAVEGTLVDLLKSGEYKDWKRALEKLEKIREEKAGHRSRIINSIGPFTRVFRKYKKLIEDGAAEGDLKVLEGYLQDPVGAFTREEPGCGGIKSILNGVRKSVENGALQLGEKESNKVLAKIELELGLMGRLRAEMSEVIKDEKRLQEALARSRVEEKKNALEEELKALETGIKKLENEKINASVEKERLRADVEKLADKIRGELEELEGKTAIVELPAF
jgi:chromosome segregation ATPase